MTLGPVSIDVWVNGVQYDQQPPILDAQLHLEYGQHDMMYLRIEVPPALTSQLSSWSLWPEDTPVAVVWGRVPDTQIWYGYVNHHELNSSAESGDNTVELTYVCIGASRVLNDATSRKWESVSATSMTRQIALENGFRSVVTPNGISSAYEVQVGESDFKFLDRMADKFGFRFWVSGGTMYMMTPTSIIQGAGAGAVPTYTCNKAFGVLDTCRNFKLIKGKNLPGSVQATRSIFGIDKSSGQPFSAVAPNTNSTRKAIKTDYAVTNAFDAQVRVQAWADLSQFWIGATAQLYGDTSVYPGKLVNIVGNALPQNGAGYWLVSKATHNIVWSGTGVPRQDIYITDVVLLRNGENGSNINLSNVQPIKPEYVRMSLGQNGFWQATNQSTITLSQ